MKVVHISTYEGGGAGRAAIRLHEALMKAGIDSQFLCAYPLYSTYNVIKVDEEPEPRWKKALRVAGWLKTAKDKELKMILDAKGHYDCFSSPSSNYKIEKHYHLYDADIVHLHWVADFLDFPTFFRATGLPIVWTFHDMNILFGGYHYALDAENNSDNGPLTSINKSYQDTKNYALQNLDRLNIVTPTTWLKNESLKSSVLQKYPHQVIPYGLDTAKYHYRDQLFCREFLKLPADKKTILFVSDNVTNKRKGFDLLEKALAQISEREDVQIIAVGQVISQFEIKGILSLGKIGDERIMSLVYGAADVVVIPSREDNLPNVMLEALCCGCPVIGFNIGGIGETIVNGKNGLLANEVCASSLQLVLNKFLNENNFNREAIAREAQEKFDDMRQASAYIKLYSQILKS